MTSIRVLATAAVVLSGGAFPIAPSAAHSATEGTVLSLVVRPDSNRVDVVVGIRGAVTTTDFVMHGPEKVVVDIANANLGLGKTQTYDNATRGGIVNVRYAQYKPNVVRVVLTLDSPHDYQVTRVPEGIRVSVNGAGSTLPAWAVGYMTSPSASVGSTTAASRGAAPTVPAPADASRARKRDTAIRSETAHLTGSEEHAAIWVNGVRLDISQQQSQQRHITINFDNQPIRDVLTLFADYSGHSMVPSKSVTGNVSASMIDVPWDVALAAILHTNGFDAVEDPNYGFFTIDTYDAINKAAAALPMKTTTLQLNYANVTAVAEMLKGRLSRDCGTTTLAPASSIGLGGDGTTPASQGALQQPIAITTTGNCPVRGTVTADTLSNSVSVTDVGGNLPDLEAYARALDKRQPQVNIKAKIILVDRTALEGLGIRYDLGSQQQFFNAVVPRNDSAGVALTTSGQIALGGNTIAAIANAASRVPNAALQLAYSTAIGAFDFTTFVEALQTTSLLDVQSEPNGTVMNNRTLTLKAGSQVPIRTTEPGAGANAAGAVAQVTVRLQQVGVILTVTPRVTNDGRVQMKIHVENSDVTFSGADAIAFPTQSVDNEVMLADGSTWVIGGLTQTSVTSTRTGIPLLVDLPVIGRLFGVTNRQELKRDLMILITPHIVDPGQDAGAGH